MQTIENTAQAPKFTGFDKSREAILREILSAAKRPNYDRRSQWLSDEPVPTRVRAGVAI